MVNAVRKAMSIMLVLLLAASIFLPAVQAAPAESLFFCDVNEESLRAGERLKISLIHDYTANAQEISAFVAEVEFDTKLLSFVRADNGEAVKNGYASTERAIGKIVAVFTTKGGGVVVKGKAFDFLFDVNADAISAVSLVKIKVSQVVGEDGREVEDAYAEELSLNILPPKSSDTLIYSLKPSSGSLSPAFSPYETEYSMTVPYEVTSLEFDLSCADTSTARVNRKNLGAGGSEVDFIITVTAEDKSVRKYTVTAHRAEKEVAEKVTSEKTTSKSSSASSKASSKTSSTTSSKASKSTSSKSSAKSTSKSAQEASSKAEKVVAEAETTTSIEAAENAVERGDISHTVVITQGEYPAFMSGAVVAFVFVAIGAVLTLVYTRMRSKKEKHIEPTENEDKKEKEK